MKRAPKAPARCPFTVLIDTGEQQPFAFERAFSDADRGYRPLAVTTRRACLGRYPDSYGDYSIDGFVGRIGIERKSESDCQSTVLGFNSEARWRFEQELFNLSRCDVGAIIVEASLGTVLQNTPKFGKKPAWLNRKILFRSILAYQADYPRVNWIFCDTRELAEAACFRILERYFKVQRKLYRQQYKELREIL